MIADMTNEPNNVEEEIVYDEVEVLDGLSVLEATDRAQINQQVATAKRYPRSVDRALKEAMTLATLDEETAASMFYVLPRAGRKIEGPSARLAEVMAYSWGNLRAEADVIAEDAKYVTAMGTCFDLERNVAVRVRVKRRITDKHGKKYKEDMIGVTSNAAISIALRNATFKVIPQALVNRIYLAARKASIGEGGTMTQKRQNALDWFLKVGVSEEQVFKILEVVGLDDIGEEELIALRGIKTALKTGETTVEQLFTQHNVSDGAVEMNEALAAETAAEDESQEPEPQQESPAQPDMEALARRSELMRDQLLKNLDRVKPANLDAWRTKHADLFESMLPEHQQLVENEIARKGRDE